MITNNLLLKLKDRNDENIAKTRDMLLSMQGKIEFLHDLKVEVDIRHGTSSYDVILITKFASMEDFEALVQRFYKVRSCQRFIQISNCDTHDFVYKLNLR
ncbi:Dabb family protein [Pelosinus sp. sgz500959]|uniref:Dabb family protein n=1 Tax=Pelosinus sp. sgz500959 TaxID=3242472 RepID=UPI00367088D4